MLIRIMCFLGLAVSCKKHITNNFFTKYQVITYSSVDSCFALHWKMVFWILIIVTKPLRFGIVTQSIIMWLYILQWPPAEVCYCRKRLLIFIIKIYCLLMYCLKIIFGILSKIQNKGIYVMSTASAAVITLPDLLLL